MAAARQTLSQPRYLRLFVVMALVALVCIGAGTWQILRFDEKVHDNDRLTRNAEIAAALCYSERTIKNIIHDVINRLQLRNRSHAVAYAVRNGLI